MGFHVGMYQQNHNEINEQPTWRKKKKTVTEEPNHKWIITKMNEIWRKISRNLAGYTYRIDSFLLFSTTTTTITTAIIFEWNSVEVCSSVTEIQLSSVQFNSYRVALWFCGYKPPATEFRAKSFFNRYFAVDKTHKYEIKIFFNSIKSSWLLPFTKQIVSCEFEWNES